MMHTQLGIRSEYSLRKAFGQIDNLASFLERNGTKQAAICDFGGTWGHVQWSRVCKENNIKPVFGVELAICERPLELEGQTTTNVSIIAKNNAGLKHIYHLVSLSTEGFYFTARLGFGALKKAAETGDIYILQQGKLPKEHIDLLSNENVYYGAGPLADRSVMAMDAKFCLSADNLYIEPGDVNAYDTIIPISIGTEPRHIMTDKWSFLHFFESEEALEQAFQNSIDIAESCEVTLPHAIMVSPKVDKTVRQQCMELAASRGVDLSIKEYADRLERELGLVEQKGFEDYFNVVSDLCQWARSRMLVGPARGSSSGSLVCYILGITQIDPIPYRLLFERFIDLNRSDLPDIDIDFPHNRRDEVIDYLMQKYGDDCVCKLGTLSRFKAKSALTDVSKALGIPNWEIKELKDSMVERSSGDARAKQCIMDTFEELEIGKKVIAKYPELKVSEKVEYHARHSGQHAAGVIVTQLPVSNYCSVDMRNSCAQIDKKDAEKIDLLKIDVLALRTLSVLDHCLDLCGWSRDDLQNYRLDDQDAFDVLNNSHFAGIFQYEGIALRSLVRQVKINTIEHVIAITALARPGPLNSGGTTQWVKRENLEQETEYLHPSVKELTEITKGVIVYQEQVMMIAREIGEMSWEDVSQLRKAMSSSLGKEFFDGYWRKFWIGAEKKGMKEDEARKIWDNMNTMGSWAFNRSHAVAYGLISYWCCVLKSKFPLEFGASCLAHPGKDEAVTVILKELVREGYKYKPYDRDRSIERWSLDKENETLIGPLSNIKGIGPKLSLDIIERRKDGRGLTPRQETLLTEGESKFQMLFEAEERWSHILNAPKDYGIVSKLVTLSDIEQDSQGEFVFIGKMIERNLRDKNEYVNQQKRLKYGGKEVWTQQPFFLGLTVEDDNSMIHCEINTYKYKKMGIPILEEYSIGDWFIWKGYQKGGFRKIYLKRYIRLTGNPRFAP